VIGLASGTSSVSSGSPAQKSVGSSTGCALDELSRLPVIFNSCVGKGMLIPAASRPSYLLRYSRVARRTYRAAMMLEITSPAASRTFQKEVDPGSDI
jgi:hypothetical protein